MSKSIHLLCAEADRARLQGLADALRQRGVRLSDGVPGRDDTVLAVLSAAFYADEDAAKKLLDLVGAGAEDLLPLQLDAADMPDTIRNAIYSRNIIPADGRDDAQIAERIVSALPVKKSRLPWILSAAALLLVAAAGLWFWNSQRALEPEAVVEVMAEPTPVSFTLPAGLTEEELAEVRCVVIAGEHFQWYTKEDLLSLGSFGQWPDMLYQVANDDWEDDGHAWYWHEDGSRVEQAAYDLQFLSMLPNLEELHMAMVDITIVPDLSTLSRLRTVWALDCRMDSVEWIALSGVTKAQLRCDVDYSPLGKSEKLAYAILDIFSGKGADFSAFSPPRLQEFDLVCNGYRGAVDLSGLKACPNLQAVRLSECHIPDLSFLEGNTSLRQLHLYNSETLRDISAVGTLKALVDLEIQYCGRIADFSPIGGCTALQRIHLQCDDNPRGMRDASFLSDLPRLTDVGLYGCELRDMDFLAGLADNAQKISFGFAGDVEDYSGLAAVNQYYYLHINPRHGDIAAVLPYLQNARVQSLMLYDCADIDLSSLPTVTHTLSIRYGNLDDLTGLPGFPLLRLELWGCQYLRSLQGLEALGTLSRGSLDIEIVNCPRLMDYSALSGSRLNHLKLVGQYALPDLGSLQMKVLRLESIPELTDLHLLDALSAESKIELGLVGLDELRDLSPLRRLNGGHLIVPPQVAEQAEELVEDHVFDSFEVAYPDGSWENDDRSVALLSLDELTTLPKALLRRVERLMLVGDTLVDMDRYDVWENWDDGVRTLELYDRQTDERFPLDYKQGIVTDLSMLSDLTGLRDLMLYDQPLTTLDGIQTFSALENLRVDYCAGLANGEAAFACPSIRYLSFKGCPVETIQGVQNLPELRELDLNDTKVTDLTPLTVCDLSSAQEEGGFRLYLNRTHMADLSPLASLGVLDNLDINDVDAAVFVPLLEKVEVHRLSACNAFTEESQGDANALFASFVETHPQLTELWIPWNQGITDLTPLLGLDGLKYVRVSFDMKEAIASLEGQMPSFQLEIEGE